MSPSYLLHVINKADANIRALDWLMTFGFVDTPFGRGLMACYDTKICYFAFCEDDQTDEVAFAQLQKYWSMVSLIDDQQSMQRVSDLIFNFPTPISAISFQLVAIGTSFQAIVWNKLLAIPIGMTVSYQHIANQLNQPLATRAVGTAIGKNPLAYLIPCHRVICASGKLGGYRWGLTQKRRLLMYETFNGFFQ